MRRRVVITGRSAICSLGDDPAAMHAALCRGENGLGPVELFQSDELPDVWGAEARDFKARNYLGKRGLRPLDRTCRLVTSAAGLALDDSGWTEERRDGQEIGLVLGTMYCSVRTIAEFDRRAVSAGPIYASPMDFANSVINAAAGQAAIWQGLKGPNTTIATGQTSGLRALEYAASLIATGRADRVLAGGAEELCLESCLAFDRLGLVSRGPEPFPIPFHPERRGMVLGEGAALVMLEDREGAENRGATILAEVTGAGSAFDPSRGQDEASARRSLVFALGQALASADSSDPGLGAVFSSANGTAVDDIEVGALAEALGDQGKTIPLTALRGALGETLGAGGAVDAVFAVESLSKLEMPGIRGLDELPPGFPFGRSSAESQQLDLSRILLSGLARDGQAAAILLTGEN